MVVVYTTCVVGVGVRRVWRTRRERVKRPRNSQYLD